MTIIEHSDTAEFLARAQSWLLASEAEHSLVLGLAASLRGRALGDALFATIEHDGSVAGCAFRTPPYKLGLTRMPVPAIAPLVEVAHRRYPTLDRVLGPTEVAAAFACEWCDRFGGTPQRETAQLIYRLDDVIPPQKQASGELRVAGLNDLPLVVQWLDSFAAETSHATQQTEQLARTRIAGGDIVLWIDQGRVCCMAVRAARTPNGARIGYVYTPPAERGHGYASACVATFSSWLLDEGCTFCTLYTDAANGTSNRIYQRMGYQLVAESADWVLGGPRQATDQQARQPA